MAFTQDEILLGIKQLKHGKAPGVDGILNEYIKNTKDLLLPPLEKLFNIILQKGVIPDEWAEGAITPIYKGKGAETDPSNYRGITLLSCMGKLFTSTLNRSLSRFLKENAILKENQAGFRSGYSTTDHIFLFKGLIDVLCRRRGKLH